MMQSDSNFPVQSFAYRHLGVHGAEREEMLQLLGCDSLPALVDKVLPESIRVPERPQMQPPMAEHEALGELHHMLKANRVLRSLIGMGYHDTLVPAVIQRNVLENPGWYTSYTPYQAEISQGRLEALLNFQTMVTDLTGLEVANGSLLDEATAAAEAMSMCLGASRGGKRFFVAETCHPQTIEVVCTRAEPLGIEVEVGDWKAFEPAEEDKYFAALVQYPDTYGAVHDYEPLIGRCHAAGLKVIVAADILALALLKTPGEMGADVAVGSTQRFGVPLGYGGPHAGYLACTDALKRRIPGRLVGVSVDSQGKPAYRLALQTREQHIRRDKATSNICTAQVLLAVMAGMYAVYHGPHGLRAIARRVHGLTALLEMSLTRNGVEVATGAFFDTLLVHVPGKAREILEEALNEGINLREIDDDTIGISLDEKSNLREIDALCELFSVPGHGASEDDALPMELDVGLLRESAFLTHQVFNSYHSETEMMRYLARLEKRDVALNESMIPLGSCTMKLNAASQMQPLGWPEVSGMHPFAPIDQAQGWLNVFRQLSRWLVELTGLAAVSLQPNAGSQGEYAGLLAIRRYHSMRGEDERDVCLIPTSAHGTNPASAVMSGMEVVAVKCDEQGNIDVADLEEKAAKYAERLSVLMVTYPSTHGVFEESIVHISEVVHRHGGQVYLDGANMNAQLCLTTPAKIGADVCHLNLHKTFCIPHGGGGPGVGPIAVAEHLVPYLPGHGFLGESLQGAVSAAPWGSASINVISWMYIAMMGADGLEEASATAILNANYMARRLAPYYPVLYKGQGGLVAHECIIDLRPFRQSAGVTVEDVAKRLIDYGFHAPTMSWPVAGTLMIEPTESESKGEIDRYCDALIAIHGEIEEIAEGKADRQDNVLKNAPHTAGMVCADKWDHGYGRERAAFPDARLLQHKFWPVVGRIDNVYGDRNLVCTCASMDEFTSEE